jgi:hypothetical protein
MLTNDIPNPAIQCVPKPVHVGCNLLPKINFNPFQSNFSAKHIFPALIRFGRERGWWITCNYPTVLKEKNKEKQKE